MLNLVSGKASFFVDHGEVENLETPQSKRQTHCQQPSLIEHRKVRKSVVMK